MTKPDPQYCNHPATVQESRTLNIDRCITCGGFLVWCVNKLHTESRVVAGTNRPAPARHWHTVDTETIARRMATGGDKYGIVRP